ncbi:hypothetical protein BDZ85DRAFT_99900 [Elsinoe ampelina]|uniref:Uncharacterized protein n=1 Tax=Elsinoe ampelina TaxID=302913 RepID=A0A6A6GFJ8_9PEZI|nr:hypothetical protein BDZ85DRAFT_99900 [Elsinoe ampelina]
MACSGERSRCGVQIGRRNTSCRRAVGARRRRSLSSGYCRHSRWIEFEITTKTSGPLRVQAQPRTLQWEKTRLASNFPTNRDESTLPQMFSAQMRAMSRTNISCPSGIARTWTNGECQRDLHTFRSSRMITSLFLTWASLASRMACRERRCRASIVYGVMRTTVVGSRGQGP